MNKPVSVTIEFPNEELAEEFLSWLCDGGGEWGFLDLPHFPGLYFEYDFPKFFARVKEMSEE